MWSTSHFILLLVISLTALPTQIFGEPVIKLINNSTDFAEMEDATHDAPLAASVPRHSKSKSILDTSASDAETKVETWNDALQADWDNWVEKGGTADLWESTKSPRKLLSSRKHKKRRRLHLAGGLCMTASKAYPQLGGRCDSRTNTCSETNNAKKGEHGNFQGTGAYNSMIHSTRLTNPTDTSATYRAGDADYINFFTCSYHYGGTYFDWCMNAGTLTGGNWAQGLQLTFALTYHDDGSYQKLNRHNLGNQIEIQWNRCSSTSDCLQRWPNAGGGGSGKNTHSITNRAPNFAHQMGWVDATDRSTQSCWGKWRGDTGYGKGSPGQYGTGSNMGLCRYWHYSSFAGAPLNKGSVANMNNAGASGIADSLMQSPGVNGDGQRQPRKYWSTSGKSGASAGSGSGGLDIDMLYRDYGPGWYEATIGGFGCEVDTDTTWFRIKGASCNQGEFCNGATSPKTRTDVYGINYQLNGCSGTCGTCPGGTYILVTSTGSCTLCAAGKKGDGSIGNILESSCLNCPDGQGSSAGATSCTQCAAGTKAISGQPCTICPTGFMSAAGASTCTNCPAGYHCPAGTKQGNPETSGGPRRCGSASSYCPYGNVNNPIPVGAGYYGALPAVAGDVLTFRGEQKCKRGYTCDGGLMSLAIPGRYSKAGMAANGVVDCSAGYFCNYGSVSSTGVTVHNERLVITNFETSFGNSDIKIGRFRHDQWPTGVSIVAGDVIDVIGFTNSALNVKHNVLASPAPTRSEFYVTFTGSRPNAEGMCGVCTGEHSGYRPACVHYGLDGKAATNEWVESPLGMKCGGTSPSAIPRYGLGHENPQACKVTCSASAACVGFTWHQGSTQRHGQSWEGGCEYVCNTAEQSSEFGKGICDSGNLESSEGTGFGKASILNTKTDGSSHTCPNGAPVAAVDKKCFAKPCASDTVALKDCSWFCLSGSSWGTKHVSSGLNGCSSYTKLQCQSNQVRRDECRWLASPGNNGNRCTDRHDKPMRITNAAWFSGPLGKSECDTRREQEACPADRLCAGGSKGHRLEFTPTKVQLTEITVTDGGKSATIGRQLMRGSNEPTFLVGDKVEIVGFRSDLDGRWNVKTEPSNYAVPVELERTEVASDATLAPPGQPAGTSIACPVTSSGCEMRLVDDRGQIPICTDASSNVDKSHRYIRESEQAIITYETGLIMNIRDYQCDASGNCDWSDDTVPPGYPAGTNGIVLPSSQITITKQRCAPGYGEDRKDYNYGNSLFKVYDNIATTTNKDQWKNWIGTSDFALATLHGYFTPTKPKTSITPQRGAHTYCTKWDLEIEVIGFGASSTATTQLCSIAVEILNENDPPQFIGQQLATRIFPEKTPPGTIIELKDNNGALGEPIGGLGSEDADAPGGTGQNNFFYLRQVNYPALVGCPGSCKSTTMNVDKATCESSGCGCKWDATKGTGAKCDWQGDHDWSTSFAISECDGNIIVNKELQRSHHKEVWLCVDVCDDAGFFPPDVGGSGVTQQKCTPSAPTNPIECPAAYSSEGVGGQLVKLTVQDLNDPPYFYDTTICTTANPCKVRENAIAGDAVYWPGNLPCEKDINGVRPSSCGKRSGVSPDADFFGTYLCISPTYDSQGKNPSWDAAKTEGDCAVADLQYLMKEPDDNAVKYVLIQAVTDKPSNQIFEIDSLGVIRVKAGVLLDFESSSGQPSYQVDVKVYDQIDAIISCPDDYDSIEKSCFAVSTLTIEIVDGNDKPAWPVAISNTASVDEDATYTQQLTGTVGQPFSADDEDASDQNSLVYTTTGSKFELLSLGNTIQLRVACPNSDGLTGWEARCEPQLDYEAATSHTLVITVTDGKASADLPVTIDVNDINEPLAMGKIQYEYTLENSGRCSGAAVGDTIVDGAKRAVIQKIDDDSCVMLGDELPERKIWTFNIANIPITENQGVTVTQARNNVANAATGILTTGVTSQAATSISITAANDQIFDLEEPIVINGGSITIAAEALYQVEAKVEGVDAVEKPPTSFTFVLKNSTRVEGKQVGDTIMDGDKKVVIRKIETGVWDDDTNQPYKVWSFGINDATITENKDVTVTQENGFVTTSFTINPSSIEMAEGATVTQTLSGGGTVTGTLVKELTGIGTTKVIVKTAIGETFEQTQNLDVGGQEILAVDLVSVLDATTPHATGTLRTELDGAGQTVISISALKAVTFDKDTPLVIGTTTISTSDLQKVDSRLGYTYSRTLVYGDKLLPVEEFKFEVNDLDINEQANVEVTQENGYETTTFKTLSSMTSITAEKGAQVTQTTPGFVTTSFTINPSSITMAEGATVTQTLSGGGTVTGTLVKELKGSGTTKVIVKTAIGETFEQTQNLDVGGTAVSTADLVSVTDATTSDVTVTGTLTTALSGSSGATDISISSASGQIFECCDSISSDLTVGSTTIQAAKLHRVLSVTTPNAVGKLKTSLTGTGTKVVTVTASAADIATTFKVTNMAITEAKGVAVSQVDSSGNTITGTLSSELKGSSTSISVTSAEGQMFDLNKNVMIGSTSVAATVFVSVSIQTNPKFDNKTALIFNRGSTTVAIPDILGVESKKEFRESVVEAPSVIDQLWTFDIQTAPATSQEEGVTVTQTSNSATGILTFDMTSGSTTTILVKAALDQKFDTSAPLVIGSTSIAAANILSAEKNSFTNGITVIPTMTISVREDSPVGYIVATKKDFGLFDIDDAASPVSHSFSLSNQQALQASIKPDQIGSLHYDPIQYYQVDALTGDITVARGLDSDGTSKGLQHLVLVVSEPDGSNPVNTLVYFQLINVNEAPLPKANMQFYCVEEMVGSDFERCADKTATYNVVDDSGNVMDSLTFYDSVTESSILCPRVYAKDPVNGCPALGTIGDSSTFEVVDPENDHISFKAYRPRFTMITNDATMGGLVPRKVGQGFGQIEWKPGYLADAEDAMLGASFKVRVNFGDADHLLESNFIAAIEVLDRNDPPEWGKMPLLAGGSTSSTAGVRYASVGPFTVNFLSPNYDLTVMNPAFGITLNHVETDIIINFDRSEIGPFQCPKHVYRGDTKKMDTGTTDEAELQRPGMILGLIPGKDPDCQNSGNTACSLTNNNELHYMISTGKSGQTGERNAKKMVWPLVYKCLDTRRTSDATDCTEGDSSCWAYSQVTECPNTPCATNPSSQACKTCKSNTAHCTAWSTAAIPNFYPIVIDEMTGEVTVNMFCKQAADKHDSPSDHTDGLCSGMAASLTQTNSMFRVPIRMEDRGANNAAGATAGTDAPSLCSAGNTAGEATSKETECNLYAEGYFEILVTPTNIAPKVSGLVDVQDKSTHGYPHGDAEDWWPLGKAKYVEPSGEAGVEIEEYDTMYKTGSKNNEWTTSVTIFDDDAHLPLTCKVVSVSPTCAHMGISTGCVDMQTHFSAEANEDSTKCVFTLATAIDFENELISNAKNTDNSVTIVFIVTDAKGRQSKMMGKRIFVKNVNEAPVIMLAPIDVYEQQTGELTVTATRLAQTVVDVDADDTEEVITYEIVDAYYDKDKTVNETNRESLTSMFDLTTEGALRLIQSINYQLACASADCNGLTDAVVIVKIVAYDDAVPKLSSAGPGGSSAIQVKINIQNINEQPEIDDLVVTTMEDTNPNSIVAFIEVEDPDGELATEATFTIIKVEDEFENDRASLFKFDDDGGAPPKRQCRGVDCFQLESQIILVDDPALAKSPEGHILDYENIKQYTITARFSDGGGAKTKKTIGAGSISLSTDFTVTVNVGNVNDLELNSVWVEVKSPKGTLSTAGGENVTISGQNFGWSNLQMNGGPGGIERNVAKFGAKPEEPLITLLYGVDTTNSTTCFSAGLCFQATDCKFARDATVLGNEEIKCKTAPGKGFDHGWRLMLTYADGQIHSTRVSTDLTAYNKPTIISLEQSENMPTLSVENTEVKVIGTDFGPVGALITTAVIEQRVEYHWKLDKLREKYITALFDCFTTIADTEITCYVKDGSGDRLEWRVTVGGQTSTIWRAPLSTTPGLSGVGVYSSSFGVPVITSVVGYQSTDLQNMRTTGGELVLIRGINFGPRSHHRRITYTAGEQKIGPSTMQAKKYRCVHCGNECRISDPAKTHTEIICETEAGIGKDLKFQVEVGPALVDVGLGVDGGIMNSRLSEIWSETFSYQGPTISSIEGMIRVSTEGGSMFSVRGSGFGPATACSNCISGPCGNIPKVFEPTVFYGNIKHPRKFVGECCRVVMDSKIECKTSAGTGINHVWHLNLAKQTSEIVESQTSYAPPSIAQYQPTPGVATAGSTLGWQEIKIIGKNFGPGFPLENWEGIMIESAIDRVSFGPENGTRFQIETIGGEWSAGECVTPSSDVCTSFEHMSIPVPGADESTAACAPTPTVVAKRPIDATGVATTTGGPGTGAKVSIECEPFATTCCVTVSHGGTGYEAGAVLTVDKSVIGSSTDMTISLGPRDFNNTLAGQGAINIGVLNTKAVNFEGVAGGVAGNSAAAVSINCDAAMLCTIEPNANHVGAGYLPGDALTVARSATGFATDIVITLTADMITSDVDKSLKSNVALDTYEIGTLCREKTSPFECDAVTTTVLGHLHPKQQCAWRYFNGTQSCESVDIDFVRCVTGRNIWKPAYCNSTKNYRVYPSSHRRSESQKLCTAGCRVSQPHEEIQCTTADVAGRGLKWKMIIDGQETTTPTTSYGIPVIKSFSGPGGAGWAPVWSKDKGNDLEISCNDNFGCRGTCTAEKFCKLPSLLPACDYEGHINWSCDVDSDCRGTCERNVFGRRECKLPVDTAPATLIGAQPDGGEYVYINGVNFGPEISSWNEKFLDKVTYGPEANPSYFEANECVVVVASKQIRCKTVPGIGSQLFWIVVVKDQSSLVFSDSSPTTYYSLPLLSSVETDGTSIQYGGIDLGTMYIEGSTFTEQQVKCLQGQKPCGCPNRLTGESGCVAKDDPCTATYWPTPGATEVFNCIAPGILVPHGPTSGTYYDDDGNLIDYYLTLSGKHLGYRLSKPPLLQADIKILFDGSSYSVGGIKQDLMIRDPLAPVNDPVDIIYQFPLPVGFGMHDKFLRTETSTTNPASGGPPVRSNTMRFVYDPPLIDNIHVAPWGTTEADEPFYRLTLEGYNFGAGDCGCRTYFITPSPTAENPIPERFECERSREPPHNKSCRFIDPSPFMGSARVNDTSHFKQQIKFRIFREGKYIQPVTGNVTVCVGDRCSTRAFENKSPALLANFLKNIEDLVQTFEGNREANKCFQRYSAPTYDRSVIPKRLYPNEAPWDCGPYPTKGERLALAIPGLELGVDLRKISVSVEKIQGSVLGGQPCETMYIKLSKPCETGDTKVACEIMRKLPPLPPAGSPVSELEQRKWCDVNPKASRSAPKGVWLTQTPTEDRRASPETSGRSLPHLLQSGFDSEGNFVKVLLVSLPPGQGLNRMFLLERDAKRSQKESPIRISYLPPSIKQKRVLDMAGTPLCKSIQLSAVEDAPCRRVPTRGLDVQLVGTNFGLYGQLLFVDGRGKPQNCKNETFGCCDGTYDPLYIESAEKCKAPNRWLNVKGKECTNADLECKCRARQSCSIDPDMLLSTFDACSNFGGAKNTRSCLCDLPKGFAVDSKNRMCQHCLDDGTGRINIQGHCVNEDSNEDSRSSVDTTNVARIWDHDSVVFQLPSGNGVGHHVEISVSGQTDVSYEFDYEPPVIFEAVPNRGPTVGTTTKNKKFIVLNGKNFGDHDAQVHLGSGELCEGENSVIGPDVCMYRCTILEHDHEQIKIMLPAGIGFNLPFRVSVGGQVSNMNVLFNYSIPIVHSIYPLHGRTDGYLSQPTYTEVDIYGRPVMPTSQIITIVGENFGTVHERSRLLRIGEHLFKGVPVLSNDTMLQFFLPQGTGVNHTVDIEIGGQVSTLSSKMKNKRFVFEYDAPIVYPINHTTWNQQTGNSNFPAQNGKYYAPTTGCAAPASNMADVLDPENPPTTRECNSPARIIIHGENFGCCVHSKDEIIRNNGAFEDDCIGGGPQCSVARPPHLVLTDENGLVKEMKIRTYGHYKIEVELPEGTGASIISVEVGPEKESSTTMIAQHRLTYKNMGNIKFSYSKPQLYETKFGLEISGADITNSFDATGSSKYGILDSELEKQYRLFLFGDNFGASQSPTNISVLAGYFNDGSESWKDCIDPVWHEASFHSAGYPYLSCYPPAVTVGSKKWRITIGSNSEDIRYTTQGRPIMGKCPADYYGLTHEYCVKCWNFNTEAAPDSPIMLANCSGVYDASIKMWKKGKQVTVGGTREPIARFGYSIWPPKECANGQCDKRSYKGMMPQESGISLVPDAGINRRGGGESKSCLPIYDEKSKTWKLDSMICDAATKPGDTCHPLRAFGKYTANPDPDFEHKDRNLHAWPPHRNGGEPPLGRKNCTASGGTWAPHVIYDRSTRTSGDARKTVLPDACAGFPYEGVFATAAGLDDKTECRLSGGSWTNVDPSPGNCGSQCAEICRMPCCLSIFEDGLPLYKTRKVDLYPGGTNDLLDNKVEVEESGRPYEFLGKRQVCSRANPCEPKFSCLGGDMCLEGYVKYYEPYIKKDGEYVCQNFHYKLPGSCPSPIATWGPITGFSQEDKDFVNTDVPHFHAYLIQIQDSSVESERRLKEQDNATSNFVDGTFDFQSSNPREKNYRDKWCDTDDTDQHCFWGTPVQVLGFANSFDEEVVPIGAKEWMLVTSKSIGKLEFQGIQEVRDPITLEVTSSGPKTATKNSLMGPTRVVKRLRPDAPNSKVKIQMYDKKMKIVPVKDLILIKYPSLRLSGVPDSIDPNGGNTEWCLEHPARCFWERNPHPKGEYDSQRQFRPQSQSCCFAPKCTECDPSSHFRMEEKCVGCPKCWWCIPLAAVGIAIFGSIAYYFLMKMRLNFVIISLALDHMQILGLLAGAKINWPWQINIILKWLVFFQLDIDVAGPECLARGIITFENKWWFKVMVPFIGMALVLVYKVIAIVVGLCCGLCCKKQKRKQSKSVKKKKHGLWEDLAHDGQSTKIKTFMIKAFITIVACCCKLCLCPLFDSFFILFLLFFFQYLSPFSHLFPSFPSLCFPLSLTTRTQI